MNSTVPPQSGCLNVPALLNGSADFFKKTLKKICNKLTTKIFTLDKQARRFWRMHRLSQE